MSELEGFSYAVFAVYAATSIGLMAASAKLGVARAPGSQRLIAVAMFGAAGLWPLFRAAYPLAPDMLRTTLDGQAADLVGHLLLASGALIAMMAEVHTLTRAHSRGAEPVTAAQLVPVGRALLLVGLFLVFPDLVQAALCLAALAVDVGARRPTPKP